MNPNPNKRLLPPEVADAVFHVAGIFACAALMMGCIAVTVQFVAAEYQPRLNIAIVFWTVALFGVSYWGWRNR